MADNQKTVPGALEGVLAVILGQNAIVVANSINPSLFSDGLQRAEFIQIGIASVTFFAVLFNWIVVRHLKYIDVEYSRSNMLFDILTAAVFGVQSQAILNAMSSNQASVNYLFLVASISFLLISSLNLMWNGVEIRKLERQTADQKARLQIQSIKENNGYNYANIAILLCVAVTSLIGYAGWAFFFFLCWLALWTYIVVITTLGYATEN